jgi:hypothetical protein
LPLADSATRIEPAANDDDDLVDEGS